MSGRVLQHTWSMIFTRYCRWQQRRLQRYSPSLPACLPASSGFLAMYRGTLANPQFQMSVGSRDRSGDHCMFACSLGERVLICAYSPRMQKVAHHWTVRKPPDRRVSETAYCTSRAMRVGLSGCSCRGRGAVVRSSPDLCRKSAAFSPWTERLVD